MALKKARTKANKKPTKKIRKKTSKKKALRKRTRSKRPPGRPTKCTPALTRRICQHIKKGNFAKIAAQAEGVSERTFHRWCHELGDPDSEDHDPEFLHFWQSITRAVAERETSLVKEIRLKKGLDAKKFILRCTARERWTETQKHEITGKDGSPLGPLVNIMNMTDEELEREQARLRGDSDGGDGSKDEPVDREG